MNSLVQSGAHLELGEIVLGCELVLNGALRCLRVLELLPRSLYVDRRFRELRLNGRRLLLVRKPELSRALLLVLERLHRLLARIARSVFHASRRLDRFLLVPMRLGDRIKPPSPRTCR